MTLNGVMAIILRYFAEFCSFRGQLHKSGWLATHIFSPVKCQSTPTKHDVRAVLFALAKFLVLCSDKVLSKLCPLETETEGNEVLRTMGNGQI